MKSRIGKEIVIGVFIALFCFSLQASPISIQELVDHPETFVQDQQIELQCYFSRESVAWLHLISNPSRYTGLFVFGKKDSILLKEKVLFPYIFVPKELHKKIRQLRSGDFVVISGKCFKHEAVGKEAVGIVADRILSLDEDGAPESIQSEEEWPGRFNPPKKARSMEPSGSALAADSVSQETYTIQLGNDSLSGLHWGQKYTLNGMEFVVTKDND